MLFMSIFLFIYMIVNGCYMSVGLFYSVFNDYFPQNVHSEVFIIIFENVYLCSFFVIMATNMNILE